MDIIEAASASVNRHPWELARLSILFKIIDQYLPTAGTKLILDMGCGDGFFAEQLLCHRQDVHILAIDPAYTDEGIQAKLSAINNERFQLHQTLEPETIPAFHEKIDMVLLLDVIEHIEDDKAFLKNLAKHPKIEGSTQFLITVPAFQSLFTKHDTFLKHYRRYTKNTLQKTVEEANLSPIGAGYFFTSLLPLRLVQKVLSILGFAGKKEGVGHWKNGSLLTTAVKKALLLDYKLTSLLKRAGIQAPGLSTYCLCKKSAS
jgi:2-polyprenyl-3-methyl-5-hydroxy-6-metoxy-1,4-benzoquinol methylase